LALLFEQQLLPTIKKPIFMHYHYLSAPQFPFVAQRQQQWGSLAGTYANANCCAANGDCGFKLKSFRKDYGTERTWPAY